MFPKPQRRLQNRLIPSQGSLLMGFEVSREEMTAIREEFLLPRRREFGDRQ